MYYNLELKHPVSGRLNLLVRESANPGGNYIVLNGKGAYRIVGVLPATKYAQLSANKDAGKWKIAMYDFVK